MFNVGGKLYKPKTSQIVPYKPQTKMNVPIKEDVKEIIRTTYSNSKNYFVYVGSLNPRKNIKNLILAFDNFKTRFANLLNFLIFSILRKKL
jgi:glycosyltransferase involved in cell wall biosynthesis